MAAASAATPTVGDAADVPKPGGIYDFWFTRLMYESGDWDVDQRMPSNILDTLLQYTTLRVDPEEKVIPLADTRMLTAAPP